MHANVWNHKNNAKNTTTFAAFILYKLLSSAAKTEGRQGRKRKTRLKAISNFQIVPQCTYYQQLNPDTLSNPLYFGQRSLVAMKGRETLSSRPINCDIVEVNKPRHLHRHHQREWHHP